MIPETPPKTSLSDSTESETILTPIVLPPSPAAVSPQKNLTGLPRVARDIAADIYNNIQKWNDQHIRGGNVMKQILILKMDCSDLYPPGLEDMMRILFEIVEKLSIYSNALMFLTSQMQALVKLQKKPAPLFVSLTIQQLAELTSCISDAYKAEFKEKQYILENIAHSKSTHEVMYFSTTWTHQKNITNNVTLKLETILTETGHRKST